jgi:hypothetical protein
LFSLFLPWFGDQGFFVVFFEFMVVKISPLCHLDLPPLKVTRIFDTCSFVFLKFNKNEMKKHILFGLFDVNSSFMPLFLLQSVFPRLRPISSLADTSRKA